MNPYETCIDSGCVLLCPDAHCLIIPFLGICQRLRLQQFRS